MFTFDKIFSNNPEHLIRIGNNDEVCYVCYKNALDEMSNKDMTNTERFRELKKLEGVFEGEPMLKLRHNGIDTCICQQHIEEISEELKTIKEEMEENKRKALGLDEKSEEEKEEKDKKNETKKK